MMLGNGKRLWKRVVMMSALLGMVTANEASAKVTLSDLNDSYAQTEIIQLVEAGIISGYEDGTFRPAQAITRADLAKILVLSLQIAEEPEAAAAFEDVPEDAWYRGYVGALVKSGITAGTSSSTFSPNDAVTREQLAVFFIRAYGLEEQAVRAALEIPFTDGEQVSVWARPYVALAYQMGFIQGIANADGTLSFAPGESAQRQALARLAYQFNFNGDQYREAANRIVNEHAGPAEPGQAPGAEPSMPEKNQTPDAGGPQPSPVAGGGGGGGGGAPAPVTEARPTQEIQAAIDAIQSLPSADQLTLQHKQAVTEARSKVDAAKAKGAADSDITNLNLLIAAENKISELEAVPSPSPESGPWIQSASAMIGGQSIAAEVGEDHVISFTIPGAMDDTLRFTGFNIQASPEVQTISVTAMGMTKSVVFNHGTAQMSVSDLLGGLDAQGDGVMIRTLRSFAEGGTMSIQATITLQSGETTQARLVLNP